jgi:hypothetical protein
MQIFPPSSRLCSEFQAISLRVRLVRRLLLMQYVPFVKCGAASKNAALVFSMTRVQTSPPTDQHWTWVVSCPDCLSTQSLLREDFHGEPKIVFKCTTCGFEKELDNPEQPLEPGVNAAEVTAASAQF